MILKQRTLWIGLIVLFGCFGKVRGDSLVIELNPSNFNTIVDGSKNVLVEFFAPWCEHCKDLDPIYEALANQVSHSQDVIIARIDSDQYKELGSKYSAKNYPMLKLFLKGKTEPITYSGGRDVHSLINFLEEYSGIKLQLPPPVEHVVTLTSNNFENVVQDPTKFVLVEFFVPWCGNCKAFSQTYEIVGHAFEKEPNVIVAKIDADKYKDIATKYGITHFPTIKYFGKDYKPPEEYTGERNEIDIVFFINQQTGTNRLPSGILNENAGRITAFDDIVANFANPEGRSKAFEAAQEAALLIKDTWADFYVNTMEKLYSLEEAGEKYLQEELSRLESLLATKDLDEEKQEEFYKQKNILNQFSKIKI